MTQIDMLSHPNRSIEKKPHLELCEFYHIRLAVDENTRAWLIQLLPNNHTSTGSFDGIEDRHTSLEYSFCADCETAQDPIVSIDIDNP